MELEGLVLSVRCDGLEFKPLNYLQLAIKALIEESNIFVQTDMPWDKNYRGNMEKSRKKASHGDLLVQGDQKSTWC